MLRVLKKSIKMISINANKLGYKIKLIGYAELINNKIYQRVHPTLIRKQSYVASINGVLNAVIVDGNQSDKVLFKVKEQVQQATTSALISDISSILRGNIKFLYI